MSRMNFLLDEGLSKLSMISLESPKLWASIGKSADSCVAYLVFLTIILNLFGFLPIAA